MKNTKGTSMVSVMVAFVILLLGIGMLYTSIRTAQEMLAQGNALLENSSEALNGYYKGGLPLTPDSGNMNGMFEVDEGKAEGEAGFYAPEASFNIPGELTAQMSPPDPAGDSFTIYYFH